MIAATSVTQTPYPLSLTLTTLEELVNQAENQGVVIKRDYSDSNEWTFLPQRKKRARLLETKFNETSESYRGIQNLPFPSWLAQPYMPALVEKGEIRAYVVGGVLMYAVHTYPTGDKRNPLSIELVDNFTPLELLE